MRAIALTLAVVIVELLSSGGCSSSSTNRTSAPCAAGESRECTAATGCKGTQLCKNDNSGFEPCICFDAAAGSGGTSSGGTGGAAGDASATGGSGGTGGPATGGTSGTASGGSDGVGGSSGSGGTVGDASATGGTGGTGGTSGTGGSAANGGTSGTGGSGGCATGLPGPALIEVPGGYCMDTTEVTNAHYAAFLAAAYPTSGQLAECSWNTTYTPSSGWPAPGKDTYPVVYVDWCDAYAYCKWAGKHLCGKIGGGANAFADFADATRSEWMNACSAGGTRTYPYGSTYSGMACVGQDYDGVAGYQGGSDVARPAGTASCEGGYPGLFDLSGNAWEWEDSCNAVAGTNDACRLRGGSFVYSASYLACGYDSYAFFNNTVNRGTSFGDIGFRCCSASL